MDVNGNEEKFFPFISNYRLNLFDYHDYENFGQFHPELQYVFEFLRYSGEKEQMKGKTEGRTEEREKGIQSLPSVVKELSGSKEQGINALIKEYQLSRKCATEKAALYC